MPAPVTDAEALVARAEGLMQSRRRRAEAAEFLRTALDATRAPALLERIHALAVAGADATVDRLARRVIWRELVFEAGRRLEAARTLAHTSHPALWEAGNGLVAGKVEFGDDVILLDPNGAEPKRRIALSDIVCARVAARAADTVEGRATLILEDVRGRTLRIGIRSGSVFGQLVAALA
jgi:hypothetical protein